MKYKNITNKVMFFKVGDSFKEIKPGQIIDLKEHVIERGLEKVSVENSFIEVFDKTTLNKMTKDELNDYAASLGFSELTTDISKKNMIKKILEFQNETN